MGLNFYYYDGLQPEMRAGIINEHECTFISTGGPGSWKDFTKSVPIVSWHEMIHFFSINPDHWYDQIFQWHHFGGHEIS